MDYQVSEYVTVQGRCPFREWTLGLDESVKGRLHSRIRRFSIGNFGQNRHLGKGLCEAKLEFGSGYRVYYGIHGRQMVVLLCGGDKKTQERDIQKAKGWWEDFLEVQS